MPSARYTELAKTLRRSVDRYASDPTMELVRAATLAGNGHNTQPWRFEVDNSRIAIRPDFSRRTPAVDPDDHHLYASLGCATENLVLAASIFGFGSEVRGDAAGVEVTLLPDASEPSSLARQISVRQCTRLDFDGRKLPGDELDRLAESGRRENVDCRIFQSREEMSALGELIIEANTAQLRSDEFLAELGDWIRFNSGQALEHRDGLYAGAMGNPSVPGWLGKRILPFVLRPKSETKRYVGHIRSSAGLAVFCADEDSPAGWIGAGRAYQHFALTATELGCKHAFLNQPVEVAELRPQLAELAGFGGRRPNLVVRFGYGPSAEYSLRRRVESVMLDRRGTRKQADAPSRDRPERDFAR